MEKWEGYRYRIIRYHERLDCEFYWSLCILSLALPISKTEGKTVLLQKDLSRLFVHKKRMHKIKRSLLKNKDSPRVRASL